MHIIASPLKHLLSKVMIIAKLIKFYQSHKQLCRAMNINGICTVVIIFGASIFFKEVFYVVIKPLDKKFMKRGITSK